MIDAIDTDAPPIARAMDRVALLLVVAIVVARCLVLETIREPFEATPGSQAGPRGATAGTSVALDVLSFVPALLVLLRRAFDRTAATRATWGVGGLVLLGALAVGSATWAADAFAAVVAGMNWLGAMALAWAASQLVRTPFRARLVAGAGVGLLLVFLAHGATYRLAELPALRETVEKDWPRILAERGWSAESFEARQFLQKVKAGEMVGFSASPNTFAALVVVTMILTAGLAVQRARDDGGRPAWAALLAVPVLGGFALVYLTRSRAALATPALAAVAFITIALFGPMLRRRAVALYAAGLLGVAAGVGAVVFRGSTTGTLFHDSLTFRWRYWLGGWRALAERPVLGVGWENFGPAYLSKRLAVASEEVRDPHNFVVRAFVELGVVGGLLMVAAVARLAWELVRPVAAPGREVTAGRADATAGTGAAGADLARSADAVRREDDDAAGRAGGSQLASLGRALAIPATVALAAMAVNAAASIDFGQAFDYVDYELRKRLLYAVLLTAGVAAGTLGASRDDARAAPWLRAAFAIAALVLLLHNAIDFSLFETGGMNLFALVAGAGVGMASGAGAEHPRRRSLAIALPAAVGVAMLCATAGLLVPIASAESDARAGDDRLAAARPGAADAYAAAAARVPYNADYPYAVARALLFERGNVADVRRWIDRATSVNPLLVKAWLMAARVEADQPQPDAARLRRAYERALAIDPQNVSARLEYADALARLGARPEAAAQLRAALASNAGLAPDEAKRLPAERVREIEARAADLER